MDFQMHRICRAPHCPAQGAVAMIRCPTCGSEMLRYQDRYGTRYQCILCGARLDERTGTVTGGRLPRGTRAR